MLLVFYMKLFYFTIYTLCKLILLDFLVACFISLYSIDTLYTINSWCLIYESIQGLQIKTYTVLIYFLIAILFYNVSHSFLIIDLYLLLPAVIAQTFNFTGEVIPTEISTNEAEAETETYPQPVMQYLRLTLVFM